MVGKGMLIGGFLAPIPAPILSMKVFIENHRGLLRLRWSDGTGPKRRRLHLGIPDSPIGRKFAEGKKVEIEMDWLTGHYDRTLLKYRPQTLGKNHTDISAAELFDRFTKHQARAKSLAQSSIKSRYEPVRNMLDKHLNVPAANVDRRKAEAFANVCLEALTAATAKARIGLLKSCWDWARKKGICHVVAENPWEDLTDRFRAKPVQKPAPFTREEVIRILTGFRENLYYSHYGDYVAFLFGVGCRPGEAAGLKWKAISEDFSSVWIGESYSRGVQGSTKTKKDRTVRLSPSIMAMLKARKERFQPEPDDRVFTSREGLPICDRNFRRRAWRSVLTELGISYRKPYVTRHTQLSHQLAAGRTPIEVAEAAGNSPEMLYQHYASAIQQHSISVEFDL
jgi:integrase